MSQADGGNSCALSAAQAGVLKTSTQIVRKNEEGLVIYMFPQSSAIGLIKIRPRKMNFCI